MLVYQSFYVYQSHFLMYLKNNVTKALHVMKNKVINDVINSTGADPVDTNDKIVTLPLATDGKTKVI